MKESWQLNAEALAGKTLFPHLEMLSLVRDAGWEKKWAMPLSMLYDELMGHGEIIIDLEFDIKLTPTDPYYAIVTLEVCGSRDRFEYDLVYSGSIRMYRDRLMRLFA